MQTFSITFERRDEVEFLIEDDPDLGWLGTFSAEDFGRFFVVIDRDVRQHWGASIAERLAAHGKEIFWYEVEPVEASKSLAAYPAAVEFIEAQGGGRFDLVLAVGGGIVQDLAGFLTSTYMRGLPLFAVPTTLIGQMDATTAGKTCLNTARSKNVLGTFYYPQVVYNNVALLATLPERQLRQGMSEVFKYGLLGSQELLQRLDAWAAERSGETLAAVLELAIRTRADICRRRDPLASNLGHTFGHAIEKLSNYEILHGDAISAGTVMALHFAHGRGLIDTAAVDRIVAHMRRLGLNVWYDENLRAPQLVELMRRDKKSGHRVLNLVLIREVEEPYEMNGNFFYAVPDGDVEDFLRRYLASSPYARPQCAAFLQGDHLVEDA